MIKIFTAVIMASVLLTSYGYAQDTTGATLLVVERQTPIRNAIMERATKRIDRKKDRLNRRATTIRATTTYSEYLPSSDTELRAIISNAPDGGN